MGELIRLVSKLRGVGGDVFMVKDVMWSIKTLNINPVHAGSELIDVGGGNMMVRSVPKGLDADQAVILSTAQEDGRLGVSEAALMSRKAYMGAGTRCPGVPLNMLLLDILCWLDEQDERHVVSYWMPSAMQRDE